MRPSWSTTPTPRGVLGRNGRGSVDHFGLHGRVAIQVGTLSKAVGALGGYVAGSLALREILTQRARPFLFSTSHPPAVVAACREAIRVMCDEPELQDRLWANTRRFKAELTRLGFDTGHSETPITPVMMGDPDTAGRFADRLIEEGVFAQPVVFPTVAIDKARLRTIVTAAHADEQLDRRPLRVRPGGPRARPDRRLTPVVAASRPTAARPARSTPTCTPTMSPDSNVPIDTYAAAALERGIAEIAITDHVDFEPGAPAFAYATFADRERIVRDAAERWGPQGVDIRFGVELTYDRSWEPDIRDHLARHAYDFTIGSVHDRVDSQYHPRRVAAWVDGRPLAEIVAPSFDEVAAAARSGLFDAIGHIDGVKRYLYPHVTPGRPGRRARALRADPPGARRERHRARGQHQRPALRRSASRSRRRRSWPASGSSAAVPSPSARTPTVPSTSAGAWRTAMPSRPRPASRS